MSTVIRTSTGESWNYLNEDLYYQFGIIAVIYWICYNLLTYFIFLELFVAVIYENFCNVSSTDKNEEIDPQLTRNDIKNFVKVWGDFNPNANHYMDSKRFPKFMRSLDPPIGFKGIKIGHKNLHKVIYCFNIPDHCGKVYFPEVLWCVFNSVAGVNDEKVNNCYTVKQILRKLRVKFKDLPRSLTLD
eukprot:CAMPEP_0170551442 /NCGR_PEP_ID=MMETSP0211-20121228/9438_1 /TAXON_ID=311385 /ORGANISM="Pseudokeronopsis sp., Strain OXSARD2" /LENGTH=186 /DNA_ID=CAMNT_0010858605 /DNA_START=342 /DNA_END=902 /DNA_ORIENTATION=+